MSSTCLPSSVTWKGFPEAYDELILRRTVVIEAVSDNVFDVVLRRDVASIHAKLCVQS